MEKGICIIDPNKFFFTKRGRTTNIYGSGLGRSEVLKTIADFKLFEKNLHIVKLFYSAILKLVIW